ncbi:MAG TPA: site-specific integrase [Gaiellaceae bacterium]|nr:site-specific integrase [Gaiellaceae bacterium]
MTVDDVQAVLAASELSPATLRAYGVALRGILDHAGVDPNPARSLRLRWLKSQSEQFSPMEAAEVVAILERVSKRLRLPLIVAEQCGHRVGELAKLTWADVDEQGCRFRLRRETTKRNRPRWVPVPAWLMDVVADSCPREDRTPERRVFVGFNVSAARSAMRQACKLAGIAHYHPHDLRHRRVSLWYRRGENPVQIAEWAGHSARMSLDVYAHVLVGGEVPVARFLELLGRGGDDTVMTELPRVARESRSCA